MDKTGEIRILFGSKDARTNLEKICVLADFFAGIPGVLGAETSMGQIVSSLTRNRPGLGDCMKLLESIHREWNYIAPNGIIGACSDI